MEHQTYSQRDLARMLRLKSVRTIQRRRQVNPAYKPDYIDPTGHPVWEAPTVQRILELEKGQQ